MLKNKLLPVTIVSLVLLLSLIALTTVEVEAGPYVKGSFAVGKSNTQYSKTVSPSEKTTNK